MGSSRSSSIESLIKSNRNTEFEIDSGAFQEISDRAFMHNLAIDNEIARSLGLVIAVDKFLDENGVLTIAGLLTSFEGAVYEERVYVHTFDGFK